MSREVDRSEVYAAKDVSSGRIVLVRGSRILDEPRRWQSVTPFRRRKYTATFQCENGELVDADVAAELVRSHGMSAHVHHGAIYLDDREG